MLLPFWHIYPFSKIIPIKVILVLIFSFKVPTFGIMTSLFVYLFVFVMPGVLRALAVLMNHSWWYSWTTCSAEDQMELGFIQEKFLTPPAHEISGCFLPHLSWCSSSILDPLLLDSATKNSCTTKKNYFSYWVDHSDRPFIVRKGKDTLSQAGLLKSSTHSSFELTF